MIFAAISFCSMSLALALGIRVLSLNPERRINQVLFWLCVSSFFWGFAEFQGRISTTPDQARFWIGLIVLWPFAVVTLLDFILEFTGYIHRLNERVFYFVAYGLAALWSLIDFFIDIVLDFWGAIPDTFVRHYYGWEHIYDSRLQNFFRSGLDLSASLAALTALVIMFVYHFRQKDALRRARSRIVLVGVAALVLIGVATDAVIPRIIGIPFPELTTASFTIVVACMGYAIWKYRLFVISPATVAEDVIRTMPDMLFVTDTFGKIRLVSQSVMDKLEMKRSQIINKPLSDLFNFEDVKEEVLGANSVKIRRKKGAPIPVDVSYAELKDEQKKYAGAVLICHDLSAIKAAEDRLIKQKKNLEKANSDLEKFNRIAVDRELRMIELKSKIEEIEDNKQRKDGSSNLGPEASDQI